MSIISFMTNGDVGKLKKIIKDEIKPIKELIEVVNHKVGKVDTTQTVLLAQIRMIKDQQSVMNDKLDNHTNSLVKIEDTLGTYADMYKVNKESNEQLEKRVEMIEDNLEISSRN